MKRGEDSRQSGASVVLRSERVEKRQDPIQAELEHLKTKKGREIGRETALFQVPRIISFDAEAGAIVFERVAGSIKLRKALIQGGKPEELMRRVGAALAAIHEKMILPPELTEPFEELDFRGGITPVFLHGDYCISNFLFVDRSNELSLIDWSTATWLGGRATWGSPYIDVSNMVQSLFIHKYGDSKGVGNAGRLAGLFLESYSSHSGHPTDSRGLGRHFFWLSRAFEKEARKTVGPVDFLRFLPALWKARRYMQRKTGLADGEARRRG